jgi:formate dehydrogenase gamma subunit
MTRYAMTIDLDECVGCQACVTSCRERWDTGAGAQRNWVRTFEHGTRGGDLKVAFYPGLCMQCETHPCTLDCPTGATFRNANGVIVVDPDLCIGCGNCIECCPYGARSVDPVKGIVEKCDLCAPFVARGEQPACVVTCLAECRVFGDLDDRDGALVQTIAARGAKPLVTEGVNPQPKVTFAGDTSRAMIAEAGQVKPVGSSWMTKAWTGATLPFARYAVPAFPVATAAAGAMVNLLQRRQRVAAAEAPAEPETLPRHRLGMRVLHWFNALSWIVLLVTGTALIANPKFALFGTAIPATIASLLGGASKLLLAHVIWGLVWAAVIVPAFLTFKRGGLEALEEIRLRATDLQWLLRKPLALAGLAKAPLPPQDKYNAGQKIFAITAIGGTATIIATGLVMAFHLGGAGVVAASIILHKLAIAFAIIGLAVHVTMAAILREERPALRSMITGRIDREHAEHHNSNWVDEIDSGRHE